MTEPRREPCPVCARVLQVTADGKIRQHGYKRGSDDLEARCEGSGQEPHRLVPCFKCHGEGCAKCNETGQVTLEDVRWLDAVIVAERALDAWPGAGSSFHGAVVIEALLKHGFIHEDPEAVPEKKPESKTATGTTEEAALMAEFLKFFNTWRSVAKGPQKPELVEASQAVSAAMESWKTSRKAS